MADDDKAADDTELDDKAGEDDADLDEDLDTEDGGQDDDEQEDKPLGPKGERALQAMKAKLKDERTKRRAAEAKLTESGKASEDKTDPDQVRKAAEDAATARANQRVLRSEIKAAAAGRLSDPKDALKFLDLDQFEVDADGEIDEDEITDAIDDLLTRKPYLAAQQTGKRFQGSGDGGARKSANKPITEEQLKAMTPTQIDKAYAEGKLSHLL